MPVLMDFLGQLTALAVTGGFGDLRYDASLPELAARYGDPWDGGRVHKESRWPHAFGWGDAHTVFCRCRRLRSFSLPTWHGELELPQPYGELDTLDTHVTESALIAALTAAGCTWETVTYENIPGQRTLEVAPAEQLRVAFVLVDRISHDEPPLDDWLLHKTGLWGYDHPDCPEPDRTLPDDGWGAAEG
ncbi:MULTISPECIES: hypothetical protein [Streptomyces]|uniref:hypothetical protein n=1 Tax=Streptomyces TaxID=1883 RepID=UPI000AEA8885|nr:MULTISPECIES: hypothetical protein [Streptomyces]